MTFSSTFNSKLIVVLTLATALTLSTAPRVQAATLTVCASGCGHTSIQGAIHAASNGDTIALEPETFFEGDIVVDRDLTIKSSSGQAVVDGNGGRAVFKINANINATLKGLRLTNAMRALVNNRGNADLRQVYAIGNGSTAVYGGIVNHAGGFMQIRDASVVAGNRSTSLGGGINNFGDLQVTGSTIMGNEGRLGGGIFNSNGDVVVGTSSISFNHATVRGGGYANANVGGGAVIVLPSSSYSGNIASDACDKYYDIHRTPACVN